MGYCPPIYIFENIGLAMTADYDETDNKLHWIIRSGMTHISGAINFISEQNMLDQITINPSETKIKNSLDILKSKSPNEGYVVHNSVTGLIEYLECFLNNNKITLVHDNEKSRFLNKVAFYLAVEHIPRMLTPSELEESAQA